MVEWHEIGFWLLGTFCTFVGAVLGYLVHVLWKAIDQLRMDLSTLQNSLPGVYVRKDDVLRMEDRIIAAIKEVGQNFEKRLEAAERRWEPPQHQRGD
jgi:hypothetical protein